MVRIFLHSDWNTNKSVFSLNAGKYGPEKTPYLDTFHAVLHSAFLHLAIVFFPRLYKYFFCGSFFSSCKTIFTSSWFWMKIYCFICSSLLLLGFCVKQGKRDLLEQETLRARLMSHLNCVFLKKDEHIKSKYCFSPVLSYLLHDTNMYIEKWFCVRTVFWSVKYIYGSY